MSHYLPLGAESSLSLMSSRSPRTVAPIVGSRPNLVILTSAQATKVNWAAKKVAGNVVANGVSFVATGKNDTVLTAVCGLITA